MLWQWFISCEVVCFLQKNVSTNYYKLVFQSLRMEGSFQWNQLLTIYHCGHGYVASLCSVSIVGRKALRLFEERLLESHFLRHLYFKIQLSQTHFDPAISISKFQIGCSRKKSTFMITVFRQNDIQNFSNQVYTQNLTYNYTIIVLINLNINLNWSLDIQISETMFSIFMIKVLHFYHKSKMISLSLYSNLYVHL